MSENFSSAAYSQLTLHMSHHNHKLSACIRPFLQIWSHTTAVQYSRLLGYLTNWPIPAFQGENFTDHQRALSHKCCY